MALHSLGKITVTTAGTIKQVSTTSILCTALYIQPLAANTGNIIPGESTLVTSTLVGAYHDGLGAGQIWKVVSGSGSNQLDPNLLYLDASVSGEAAIVYYEQA